MCVCTYLGAFILLYYLYVSMGGTTYLFYSSGNSYNDAERCVCAGYDNGDIKLFDLRTMSLKWETNVKNGVSCDV